MSKPKTGHAEQCRVCGLSCVDHEDVIVRISTGKLVAEPPLNPDFDETGQWGLMHQSCFLKAIGDRAFFRDAVRAG